MKIKFVIKILLKDDADESAFDDFLRELLRNDKRVDQFTVEEIDTE